MRPLERRIKKLEEESGGLPCDRPGHDKFFLFVKRYGDEFSAEDQARMDSRHACPKCKDKAIVILTHYVKETPEQVMEPTTETEPFQFNFTRQEPDDDVNVNVVTAPWLRKISEIGDD